MLLEPHNPGETPLDDLSGLRIDGISTKAALNAAEAENIRKATLKYLAAPPSPRLAPFDVAWMLRLHAEMFGDVWAWAGLLRTSQTSIGSAPHDISVDLHSLHGDMRAWVASKMLLQEQAVRLHHRAVCIHPFVNGNGRWSRMLANVWLMLHRAAPIEWPEATIGTTSLVRNEYLVAMKAADQGDHASLLALHHKFTRR